MLFVLSCIILEERKNQPNNLIRLVFDCVQTCMRGEGSPLLMLVSLRGIWICSHPSGVLSVVAFPDFTEMMTTFFCFAPHNTVIENMIWQKQHCFPKQQMVLELHLIHVFEGDIDSYRRLWLPYCSAMQFNISSYRLLTRREFVI